MDNKKTHKSYLKKLPNNYFLEKNQNLKVKIENESLIEND